MTIAVEVAARKPITIRTALPRTRQDASERN
jgi:hypothetical protein